METIYKPLSAFKPLYKATTTFYAYHGGRGGGKSWGIADYLLLVGAQRKHRILCCREVQKSIKESVHRLLSDRIEALGLTGFYDILETEIRGKNGTTFNFSGLLQHTVASIKSFEGATITWIEEAQTISRRSLDILIPTVLRTDGAIVIYSLNPYLPTDPVYADYVNTVRDDCTVVQINYSDNPHCPDLLKIEADKLAASDYTAYENIWLGKPKYIADGAIYKAEFEQIRRENRICRVPYDSNLPVFTSWDLGILDPTAIWFFQTYGKEIRAIDYYEAVDEPLSHYARILREKGYGYEKHFAPHDIEARDMTGGISRRQTMANLGYIMEKGARLGVDDRIEAARQMLARTWFDAEKCKRGLDCLQNYRRAFNERMGQFKAEAVHDWASHGSDAFGEGALAINKMFVVPPPPVAITPPKRHHWNRR